MPPVTVSLPGPSSTVAGAAPESTNVSSPSPSVATTRVGTVQTRRPAPPAAQPEPATSGALGSSTSPVAGLTVRRFASPGAAVTVSVPPALLTVAA